MNWNFFDGRRPRHKENRAGKWFCCQSSRHSFPVDVIAWNFNRLIGDEVQSMEFLMRRTPSRRTHSTHLPRKIAILIEIDFLQTTIQLHFSFHRIESNRMWICVRRRTMHVIVINWANINQSNGVSNVTIVRLGADAPDIILITHRVGHLGMESNLWRLRWTRQKKQAPDIQ